MIARIHRWNNEQMEGDSAKITISVELEKPRASNLELLVKGIDYVFIGKDFARYLQHEAARAAVEGIKRLHPGQYTVICPWGASDTVSQDAEGRWYSQPTYPPSVIRDSLGAGDTFVAGCIFKLFVGKSTLPEALEYASRLAGAKLAHFGFDIPGYSVQ
ncbi:ketohexokinase-like [Anopheles darlingi]|nr:ketohexokinase-like [Anopheles darlingi]